MISPSRNRTAGPSHGRDPNASGQDSPGSRLGLVQGANDEVELHLGDEAEGVDVGGLLETSWKRGRQGPPGRLDIAAVAEALGEHLAGATLLGAAGAAPPRRGPARPGRGSIAVTHVSGDDRRVAGGAGSPVRRPAAGVQQALESRQTFGMMGAGGPHVVHVSRQPQADVGLFGRLRRPVEGDAQVAELAEQLVEGDDPGLVLTVVERPGEDGVVLEMPSPPVGTLPAGVEQLTGELADRLEQPVTGRAGGAIDDDERRAHEFVDDLERLVGVVIDTHGGEGRQVAPTGEHAHRQERGLAGRRQQLMAPVEGGPHRAMTGQHAVTGPRQLADRVAEPVGEVG